MTEYEKKIIVTEIQFKKIYEFLKGKACESRVLQINYYYDTEEFDLYNKNETLRIRQKERKLELEYKYGKKYDRGVRKCEEISKSIENVPLILKKNFIKNFDFLEQECYILKGNMVTERYNFDLADVIISLDCNYYLGKMDLELEVEGKGAVKTIENWCNKLELVEKRSGEGKYTRFVKQYKRLNRWYFDD